MASEKYPPFRLSDLGPCKLSWLTPPIPIFRSSYLETWTQMGVFWSKYNDELQHVKPQLRGTGDIFTGDTVTKEKIKYILQHPRLPLWGNYLVQFWGLVKIGDKMYLTTCDQPFALSYNNYKMNKEGMKGLCEYRKKCLNYLIPVGPNFQEEEPFGPPGRVFYSGLPEYVDDIRHYSPTEYPLYDYAVNRVKEYWVLPVRIAPANSPIGVLEIASASGNWIYYEDFVKVIKDIGLSEQDGYDQASRSWFLRANSGQEREIAKINKVLEVVREAHRLTLAQTWMLNSVKALTPVGIGKSLKNSLYGFIYASSLCFCSVGQGVVGKSFSSKSACYCRDVKQLSIKEYPLVPNARKYGFSGCFAVSLQSSSSNNCYTLEFFLPSNETNNGDPRTLLHMLMLTLKEQLQGSFKIASGQELGQKLFVEVIKVSSDDTLDFFEICHTSGSGSESAFGAAEVYSRGGMMPPESSSHQQVNAVNNSTNGVHEHQIGIVGSPAASKPVENIVSITHQQPNAELDVANRDRDGVILEQSGNDVTALRKENTLESERGITRETLEQISTMKLGNAAKHLGVSRSTLKRISRKYDIHRWPPHTARKNNQAFSQEKVAQPFVENNEGQSRSDATRQQEHGSITVKATYGDDIIKFQLPFSARKMDLEENVVLRLHLPLGSFKIKYLDEDNDWILVTCDKDLSAALSTLRLQGKTTLKMLVI